MSRYAKLTFILFIIRGCLMDFTAAGQTTVFTLIDTIPVESGGNALQNPWLGGINFPLVSEIDLDGNGTHDLFLYDRVNHRISTFINDGSAGTNCWHSAPQYASRFPTVRQWAVLYDYNCDGRADFFTLSPCQCGIAVYRNDFQLPGGLTFTSVTDTLHEPGNTQVYANPVAIPAFSDVDNDGDVDLFGYSSVPDGRVIYHINHSAENGFG